MPILKLDIGLRTKQMNAILERLDNVTRELHDLTMAINSYNLVTDAPPPRPSPEPVDLEPFFDGQG